MVRESGADRALVASQSSPTVSTKGFDHGELEALARRCEAATTRSREMDIAIALAQPERFFNAGPYYEGAPDRIGMINDDGSRSIPGSAPDMLVPRYTASLDAAMTLVPEGWRLAALCEREPWFARLETLDFKSVTWGRGGDWITDHVSGKEATASAPTPALALCAVALRARAAT